MGSVNVQFQASDLRSGKADMGGLRTLGSSSFIMPELDPMSQDEAENCQWIVDHSII